jgi:hypothetical protein
MAWENERNPMAEHIDLDSANPDLATTATRLFMDDGRYLRVNSTLDQAAMALSKASLRASNSGYLGWVKFEDPDSGEPRFVRASKVAWMEPES